MNLPIELLEDDRVATPWSSEQPLSIRECFDWMADAHMHVFGMNRSPARQQVWEALEQALKRNLER